MLGYHENPGSSSYDTSSFHSNLKNKTQLGWFKRATYGDWRQRFKVPFSTILTRHGYCFSFNMRQAESLLYLDKWECDHCIFFKFIHTLYLYRVSSDFHYTVDVTAKATNRNPLANSQKMPWNSSGEEKELEISFYEGDKSTYDFSNTFQPLQGMLVIIHSPDEFVTQSDHHFYLGNTSEISIKITPEIISIADELKSAPVKERNCFLPGERQLEYYRVYTKNNCEQECLSMAAFKTCGCVPFYLIRKFVHFYVIISNHHKQFEAITKLKFRFQGVCRKAFVVQIKGNA